VLQLIKAIINITERRNCPFWKKGRKVECTARVLVILVKHETLMVTGSLDLSMACQAFATEVEAPATEREYREGVAPDKGKGVPIYVMMPGFSTV
jgi:hypothetical protein